MFDVLFTIKSPILISDTPLFRQMGSIANNHKHIVLHTLPVAWGASILFFFFVVFDI